MYTKHFLNDQIQELKDQRNKKAADLAKKYGAYNNLVYDVRTRWVGDAGELAFYDLMTIRYGYIDGISLIHHTTRDDIDDRDFTIVDQKKFEIDVKTMAVNCDPMDDYWVNMNQTQYRKLMRDDNKVNMLVFCYYHQQKQTATIVGWLFKKEFADIAVFKEAGEKSDKMTIQTDCYCCQIQDLRDFSKIPY